MTLRARLSLGTALALALAITAASTAAYFVVRTELRGGIDAALRRSAANLARLPASSSGLKRIAKPIPTKFGGAAGYFQFVTAAGSTHRPPGENERLPVSARARSVAAGRQPGYFGDVTVAGTHLRVYTKRLNDGIAIQIARPLTEVDAALSRIKLILAGVLLGGILLAAMLGLAVARAALAPVRRLTAAAERIAASRDLRSRTDAYGSDELGRLARAFNTMLEALAQSVGAQRQLVADASHELRTPLASARTNLEVLELDEQMPAEERRRALAAAIDELGEMTHLIEELVELARGEQQHYELEDVRLDLVVEQVVAGAARRALGIAFAADLEPTLLSGSAPALARAVGNLLDNAVKWSPAEGSVEVRLAGGTLTVRDHGSGLDEADLPFVFDRFYRSAAARTLPGSGLGLAIVRQVAEAHGGSVGAEHPEAGRGTVFRLTLPCLAFEPGEAAKPAGAGMRVVIERRVDLHGATARR